MTDVTSLERTPAAPTDRRPPLARLVLVELRKATDTRAGRWLLIAVAVLTVAAVGTQLTFGNTGTRTLRTLVVVAQWPVSVLLPVLGVLAVTSEWSRRTALVTFAQVPARDRVVAAKVLAVSLLALGAAVVAVAVGVAGYAAGRLLGRAEAGDGLSGTVVAQLCLVDCLTMLCGTGFGLLLLHTAPAIVTYYALPIGWSILGQLVPGLETAAEWLDVGRARVPLTEPGVTGTEWARLLTASLLWVALPAALGTLRLRRAEIS
jgi:ABC-2 type transport system permease protein